MNRPDTHRNVCYYCSAANEKETETQDMLLKMKTSGIRAGSDDFATGRLTHMCISKQRGGGGRERKRERKREIDR